jgi:hypothetical protein
VANEDKTYTAIFAEDLTSDISSINSLIADAKTKADSGDYTEESSNALKAVVEEVEKAVETAATRAELNALKAQLQEAINGLEVKPAEPEPTPAPEVEAPGQVTGVTVTATTTTVTLKWAAVEGAEKYQVLEWKPAQKKYVAIGTTDKLTYTAKGKGSGNTYRYKVRAYKVSDSGNVYGKYSKIAKVITKPKKVTVKSATKKSNTTVTLKFTNSPKATSYIIYEQNATTKKYQIAYKIEGKKLYKYIAKTKKYKAIGKASLSKTKIWTTKLTGLNLKTTDKNAKFMVKAVRSSSGYKDATSAASNAKAVK